VCVKKEPPLAKSAGEHAQCVSACDARLGTFVCVCVCVCVCAYQFAPERNCGEDMPACRTHECCMKSVRGSSRI
jgi:hypothetical protein